MPFALGNSTANRITTQELMVTGDILCAGHVRQAFRDRNTEHQDHTELKNVQTGHIEIGNHETRNTVSLFNFGPKISFAYTFRFQADTIITTKDSKIVKLHLLDAHGLKDHDTITIHNVSGTEHNGITKEQLTGEFTLQTDSFQQTFPDEILIETEGTATQSSSIVYFTADVTCTVYSTLDLHGDATTWTRSTTKPGTVLAPNGTRLNSAPPVTTAVA